MSHASKPTYRRIGENLRKAQSERNQSAWDFKSRVRRLREVIAEQRSEFKWVGATTHLSHGRGGNGTLGTCIRSYCSLRRCASPPISVGMSAARKKSRAAAKMTPNREMPPSVGRSPSVCTCESCALHLFDLQIARILSEAPVARMQTSGGWCAYAGRPRDAAARCPDHHRRDQAWSRAPPPLAEPVRGPGVLPRDGASGGRARPPAAPAWPGSPPRAPLGGALSASRRATALFSPAASTWAQECPFQAKECNQPPGLLFRGKRGRELS